jgi:hypothetical protein
MVFWSGEKGEHHGNIGNLLWSTRCLCFRCTGQQCKNVHSIANLPWTHIWRRAKHNTCRSAAVRLGLGSSSTNFWLLLLHFAFRAVITGALQLLMGPHLSWCCHWFNMEPHLCSAWPKTIYSLIHSDVIDSLLCNNLRDHSALKPRSSMHAINGFLGGIIINNVSNGFRRAFANKCCV